MNNKTNILVFIDWYYPGFKAGGPVRSCRNMVAHLNEYFNFFIVTSNCEYTETIPYQNIEFNKWILGPENEQIIYLDQHHQTSAEYLKLFKEREYSSVMIFGLFSKNFSRLPLKIAKDINCKKIIVSPRGMLAPEALQIKGLKKKLFLKWSYLTGNYKGVTFHVSNLSEADQVKKNIRAFKEIIVASNFSRKTETKELIKSVKQEGKLKLISVARIAPEKNTKYALEILSKCKGNIEFDIYGPIYNEDYWNECKNLMEKMPKNILVNYIGHLESDKLFDVLPNYDFLFLPTRGENFGHIILESFICGLPVIISNRTPWNDLQSKRIGFEYDLKDSDGFKQCIEGMVEMSSVAHNDWKKNAFDFGQSNLKDEDLKNAYIKLLQ